MAYSSGMRSLFLQTGSWAGVAVLAAAVFIYYPVASDAERPVATAPAIHIATTPPARSAGGSVELRAAANGHFHARADINGSPIPVMVDTGASVVVLTYADARRAGLFLKPSDFTQPVATANGTARVAPVTLDTIRIGDITVRNVRAAVADEGQLTVTLLGMTFLSQIERVEMRDGVLSLKD